MADDLLTLMAGKGKLAEDCATAICNLVMQGAELGALDEIELIGPDGTVRIVRIFPKAWLERLQKAVNVGAFEKLTVDQIVERILIPPADEGENPTR